MFYTPYSSSPDSRTTTNGAFSPKTSITKTNKNNSTAKKKSSNKLVDVTDEYIDEEEDITCGICDGWDPPLPQGSEEQGQTKKTYTTSWVGCDCGKWYHKQCTNRKRFTANFKCKSVKRKCQKTPLVQKNISNNVEDSNTILDNIPSQDIYTFSDSEAGELILP